MPTNVLSDSPCRAAQPAAKAYKLSDGEGLHLFVAPTGGKLWRLAYRFGGKQKQASFGSYPAVSLAAARSKRDAAKTLLHDGFDPMAVRKETKVVQTINFSEDCRKFWGGRNDLSAGYVANAMRAMEMHLYPFFGSLPVGAVTRADILATLNRMDAAVAWLSGFFGRELVHRCLQKGNGGGWFLVVC